MCGNRSPDPPAGGFANVGNTPRRQRQKLPDRSEGNRADAKQFAAFQPEVNTAEEKWWRRRDFICTLQNQTLSLGRVSHDVLHCVTEAAEKCNPLCISSLAPGTASDNRQRRAGGL